MAVDVLASRHQRSIFEAKLRSSQRASQPASCTEPFNDARLTAQALDVDHTLRVLVAEDTLLYRYLGRSLVGPEDCAFEVGSSYGHCTAVLAATARRVVGIDVSDEVVTEARRLHPDITFVCGDIFSDLQWLQGHAPAECTALFLDINGNRNYKPVVDALRICLGIMPNLRLVVVKSKELRSFLLHNGLRIVMNDLCSDKAGDEHALAIVRETLLDRGGEVPLHLLNMYNPEVRFLIGRNRMTQFFSASEDIEVYTAADGPEDLRCRLRLAGEKPKAIPPASTGCDSVAEATLLKEVRKCFGNCPDGVEKNLRQIMSHVKRNVLFRYTVAAPASQCYLQASDARLDPEQPVAWSDAWQFVVSMRHLHSFLQGREEFELCPCGPDPLTVSELREVRVSYVGNGDVKDKPSDTAGKLWLDAAQREALQGRPVNILLVHGEVSKKEELLENLQVDVKIEQDWLLQ
eukprot:TRINITY_DN33604_c0_g1_i1.p1 TRINITY_DN33604_c0_g1~~TRINITY_DN33604_c0_g1_i1.p1  ORF type:complete len:462 (-),score=68.16 TRINITY_DN33604_c0_g1_i1:405-1790(-)